MLEARPFERIRIASRTRESARAARGRVAVATAVETVEEAVRGADVVCTVTLSAEPVVLGEWLRARRPRERRRRVPPDTRELDSAPSPPARSSSTGASRP